MMHRAVAVRRAMQQAAGVSSRRSGDAIVTTSFASSPPPFSFPCLRSLSTALPTSTTSASSTVTTIPPNLSFDPKSSFAPSTSQPQKKKAKPQAAAASAVSEEDEELHVEKEDFEEEDDFIFAAEKSAPRIAIPLPQRLKVPVYHSLDGTETGTLHLDASVFGQEEIRLDLIKLNVNYIRNKLRGRRKAKTKTISEVSGSGRKVRKQKGTGQARAGHSRPAHWRGGAKAHGPKNTKDYGKTKLNKKQKRLAICSVLSQKLLEGNLILVDHLKLPSHRTNEWAKLLEQEPFDVSASANSAYICDHYPEENESEDHASFRGIPINLSVASGNLHYIQVVNQQLWNVYDALKKDKLILTLDALEQMEQRWRN